LFRNLSLKVGKMGEVLNSEVVDVWLEKACNSPKTKKLYSERFKLYARFIGMSPDQIVSTWREVRYNFAQREAFLNEHSELIEKFYCTLKNYAPMTRRGMLIAVLSFYKHNHIPIDVRIKQRVYVVYHNRAITKEEVRRILDHANLRDRTFFLIMLESGLRPNTIVQLRYRHIKEEFEKGIIPMKIELDADMLKDNVGKRFTFIGEDAHRCLKEYLAPRMPLKDDEPIFKGVHPRKQKGEFITPNLFSLQFNKIVKKLGIAKQINNKRARQNLNLYCLRKYFRNNIRVSDPAYREFWMGHSLGTDRHYFDAWLEDPNIVEKHRQEYAKAYPSLRVYEPTTPYLTPEQVRQIVMEFLKTEEGQALINQRIAEWLRKAMEGAEVVK
jgi:integrase